MCIYVSPNSDELIKQAKEKNTPVQAWKALAKLKTPHSKPHTYESPYIAFPYHQGLNIDREHLNKNNPNLGLHCYQTLQDAINSERTQYIASIDIAIFPVTINPNDLLAFGTFGKNFHTLTCSKLTIDLSKPIYPFSIFKKIIHRIKNRWLRWVKVG